MPKWLVQSKKISNIIDRNVFKIKVESFSSWHLEVDSKAIWAPRNDHNKRKMMVQLHTFRFFQLAYVRWRELICPYLNTKRSSQEPNQDLWNGGCRREYVMTKFAINTNVIRISYVPRQATNRESHSPLLSHTIFVLVPIPFRVSQSQTILIQWWALEGLLHLWHAAEKKRCCRAGWSFYASLFQKRL